MPSDRPSPAVLQCVVVDDEPLAVDLLCDYLSKTDGVAVAARFSEPLAALQYLRATPPDVLLLDIQMPGLNGLELATLLGDTCRVILTTAYSEYALQSYELRVVDYLLKPISYVRFLQALERVQGLPSPTSLVEIPQAATPYVFVKSGHRTERVDVAQLRYLTGAGDYVELHLVGGRRLLTLENLSSLAERLPTAAFCRIHRSHVVALAHVDYVERGRVVLGKDRLPISDGYAEGFRERLER